MKPVALVFDMDGVIVDSNPYHKKALQQFCAQHGYSLSEAELRQRIYGRTNREWITNLMGPLPEDVLARYAEEKEALYRDLFAPAIRPVAGLPAFLEALAAAGYPCAIGTSAPRSNVDFTLQRTGLAHYFPVILDDRFVAHSKPHPEIYLKCAEALALPPAQCLVLEDSLSGVEAAQRAGCKVVGIATTHTPAELAHTDAVLADFTDVSPQALIARVFG